MIATDLSKQQALDADPKVNLINLMLIQQINFTANLNRPGNTILYFILKEAKKQFLNFHKEL